MSKKNLSPLVGFLSSVLAFLGIISCCGFPLLAAFLAWFGIGASQLSFFAVYQAWFTGIAIVALVYGFYTIYFKNKKAVEETSCCNTNNNEVAQNANCCEPSNKKNAFAKAMLWIGVVAIGATFFLKEETNANSSSETSCCPTTETVKEAPACDTGCEVPPPTKRITESEKNSTKSTSCCPN